MIREWKPGDVAMVECSDGEWRRAGYRRASIVNSATWEFEDGSLRRVDDSNARPAVVIDPEDREQVDRLTKAVVEAMYAAGQHSCAANGIHPDTTQAALRSLIEPPKPEEPTGLGAVVEDVNGLLWTRVESGSAETRNPWYPAGDPDVQPEEYRNIAAVDVLSKGVTA